MKRTRGDKGPERAVALRYDGDTPPRVVAKGEGRLAQAIVEAARAHGVPLREDPELAALLARVDLEACIPPELYEAVATVLAFVYALEDRAPPRPPPSG